MTGPLCAVVLAAGEGTRLRPLTLLRPKALCPVGNVALLDRTLAQVDAVGLRGPAAVAVNASWLAEQVGTHVAGRAQLSVEADGPLGTTGGVVRLREWIDGRPVLVANSDAYRTGGPLEALLDDWDGERVRLLGVPGRAGDVGTFGGFRFAGASLLPWRWVRDLDPAAPELVQAVWRPAEAAGALQVVEHAGHFADAGTPAAYLAANLHAADLHTTRGGNLIADGAVVTGHCHRAVVWPGAHVGRREHLIDAVRAVHAGRELTVAGTGQADQAGQR